MVLTGVGAETLRALAGAGAAVTMAVRRVDVAEPVAAELRRSAGTRPSTSNLRLCDVSVTYLVARTELTVGM